MSKYRNNITGEVRGLVQGDGKTVVMNDGDITSINGRSKEEVGRRYQEAMQLGCRHAVAMDYATAAPEDEAAWQQFMAAKRER